MSDDHAWQKQNYHMIGAVGGIIDARVALVSHSDAGFEDISMLTESQCCVIDFEFGAMSETVIGVIDARVNSRVSKQNSLHMNYSDARLEQIPIPPPDLSVDDGIEVW